MESPQRIVFILPCCIGDVVLATATLKALRRGYPQAHITWAVGSWSRPAVEHHDLLDSILDTGPDALPVKSRSGFVNFVYQLRAGNYDLAVSLVRSPLMSLAVWLSGIRYRAGLNSGGRGFGYNFRAPIDPRQPRHEAEIYLDVAHALGLDTTNCYANVPVSETDRESVQQWVGTQSYLVLNPAGGRNPGMMMDIKRWPPENFAALAERLVSDLDIHNVVLVAGPDDESVVEQVASRLQVPFLTRVGVLSFGQIAALARGSDLYIGNDTGLTHLAAAAGTRTVMILGPSDPIRYAPFTPQAIALWKPVVLREGGVAAGQPLNWDWMRDGISVEEAHTQIMDWLALRQI